MDSTVKDVLKSLKQNESTVSMVLGSVVVMVVMLLVYNYFQTVQPTPQVSQMSTETETTELTMEEENGQLIPAGLPRTHLVQAGDTLWSISEKYYASGYNWTDIVTANNLATPNEIEVGMELLIPRQPVMLADGSRKNASDGTVLSASQTQRELENMQATGENLDVQPSMSLAPQPDPSGFNTLELSEENSKDLVRDFDQITSQDESHQTYIVKKGDCLWVIAVAVYGDGYRWTDIYAANSDVIADPNVIFTGWELIIP